MSIEDIIAMVRSGVLRLLIRNMAHKEENQLAIVVTCEPDVLTPEMLEAFQQHQVSIFKMIKRSDIQMCIAPDEHRASYRFQEDILGKVFMCPLCEAIREEAVRNLPPADTCPHFDLAMTGQVRKEQ